MAKQNSNKQLYDLLASKNFDPQMLNAAGQPAADPANTDVFSFDWVAKSGNDYGTVAILLGDEQNMDVYFGDNLGKSMEADDKQEWYDFLYQLRMLAKRNLLSFGVSNLNKLKYTMKGQAALKEGLFESWSGNRTTSWNNNPKECRLVIKHSKPITENDKRYRYIQALFLETNEGERFKLPFTKLSGGRAMLEHVRQGGNPYDMRGQHISEIVNEMNLLSRFKRASAHKVFEGVTQDLVEGATRYYEQLQKNIKSLSSSRGYTTYFESWTPMTISKEDMIIEDLKSLFIQQNIDSRIEQALPLLAKIQQEENKMKELSIFEGWIGCLSEGTWALPDTPQKQQELIKLLSEELTVGADATNATEQLYDVLGDDVLFDRLKELAERNANADARTVIIDRLEEMKDNPSVAQVIGKLKIETVDTQPQPEEEEVEVEVEKKDINEDHDAVGFVKELAQQAMVDFGYYDASEFKPEELDMIAGEAQVGLKDVCDILGVKCPELSEDAGEMDGMPETVEEGAMKDVYGVIQSIVDGDLDPWDVKYHPKDAAEQEVARMIEDEYGEIINSDQIGNLHPDDDFEEIMEIIVDNLAKKAGLEEGIKGALAGGALGALAGGPAGAVRGAQVGNVVGDMFDEDAVMNPDQNDDSITNLKNNAGIKPAPDYEFSDYDKLDEATSRKDFKRVAEILKNIENKAKQLELANVQAEIFQKLNPRFSKQKFFDYIGIGDEVDTPVTESDDLSRLVWLSKF